MSDLNYRFIEKPFRKNKFDKSIRRIRSSGALAIYIILLIAFIGMGMIDKKGTFKDSNLPPIGNSKPWNWDLNCQVMKNEFNPLATPCLYKSSNSKSNLLLIGDSQAASISKTVVDIGLANNADVYVFTYSGCPFITNTKGLEMNFNYPYFNVGCLRHNKQILEFLSTIKIDTIIYKSADASNYSYPNSLNGGKVLNLKLLSEWHKIESFDSKLIFLGITPLYLGTNSVIGHYLRNKPNYSLYPSIDNEYWKFALASGRTTYVDIFQLFCSSPKNCHNKIANNWLFVDTNHLSQFGGALIKPYIVIHL